MVSLGTASVGVVPWGRTLSGYLTYTWQYPIGGLAITRATPTAFVLVPQPRRDWGTTRTRRVPAAGIYPLLAVSEEDLKCLVGPIEEPTEKLYAGAGSGQTSSEAAQR